MNCVASIWLETFSANKGLVVYEPWIRILIQETEQQKDRYWITVRLSTKHSGFQKRRQSHCRKQNKNIESNSMNIPVVTETVYLENTQLKIILNSAVKHCLS